jgi:hypothetical protein
MRQAVKVTAQRTLREPAPPQDAAAPLPAAWPYRPGMSNRALARVAGRSQLVLARYDTGEHARFGTDRVVFERGGVQVTESDMLTMGDLYERVEDMYQADPAELRKLVDLIRRDKAYHSGAKGVKSVSNREWGEATPKGPHRKKDYWDLAKENATHYAPRPGGGDGKDHKAEWERVHRQALDIAHNAKTPADKRRAEAYNAFAGHFLTDAFSAGHLIPKQDVMDAARRNWDKQETFFDVFKETAFTRLVARRLLADPRSGPKLKAYRIRIVDWGEMSDVKLSELLYQIGHKTEYRQDFFNSFVKVLHDIWNKRGIWVDNARGDGPWILYGDQYLYKSPKTLSVGQAAFEQSWLNLMAAEAPGPVDYKAAFKDVWDYVPVPTQSARKEVDDLVAKVTDPDTAESVYFFTEMLADHIDDMIDKLRDANRLATPEEVRKEAIRKMPPFL